MVLRLATTVWGIWLSYLGVDQGTATTMMLHAMLGGHLGGQGQDFASGAIAGGVAEGLTPIANGLLAQYVSDKLHPVI